jgi:hypothetical protein
MAIQYEALFPEVLPHVAGCLDSIAENAIRSATIDLCERAGVYRKELDPLSSIAGTFSYDFDTPIGTTVHRVEWITYDGEELEPISSTLLEQRIRKWREETGQPEYYVQQSSSTFYLAPVPSSSVSLGIQIRAVLKPTHNSSACDNDVMNNYRDTIVNGALFRLLRMPNVEWSDMGAAGVYSNLFMEGVERAEQDARGANVGVYRKVKYGGIQSSKTGSWRRRTRDYGNKY